MYLALYRKYRPRCFEDVISQPHITTTLKQQVSSGTTAHSYLFTGTRGTGKTTCSKILAMAINCENPINGDPCMVCDSCKGIEQGSTLDVSEIDAASNNGVDNIRQLRDEASFTPTSCKYRVYIIDEAHMLSIGAFNALLKIMEEPPPHVVFILATTEAHKVPATILSRCQRFDFRRVKLLDIAALLTKISKLESVSLDEDAALLLARVADGGMRDALSLMDQCIAYSHEITVDVVTQAVGIVGDDFLYEITDCIIDQDATTALSLIDKLYSMSKDLQSLLEELIFHFRNIMLAKVISADGEQDARIKQYANKITLPMVLLYLAEFQTCLDKMSRNKRLSLEMCLVKLCAPQVEQNQPRVQQLPATVLAAPSTYSTPQVESIPPQVEVRSQATAQPENATQVEYKPLMQWAEVLEHLASTDKPLWGVLHGSSAQTCDGFMYIESPLDFLSDMLRKDSNATKLVAAVAKVTGVRYKIRIKNTVPKVSEDPMLGVLARAADLGVPVNEG